MISTSTILHPWNPKTSKDCRLSDGRNSLLVREHPPSDLRSNSVELLSPVKDRNLVSLYSAKGCPRSPTVGFRGSMAQGPASSVGLYGALSPICLRHLWGASAIYLLWNYCNYCYSAEVTFGSVYRRSGPPSWTSAQVGPQSFLRVIKTSWSTVFVVKLPQKNHHVS